MRVHMSIETVVDGGQIHRQPESAATRPIRPVKVVNGAQVDQRCGGVILFEGSASFRVNVRGRVDSDRRNTCRL